MPGSGRTALESSADLGDRAGRSGPRRRGGRLRLAHARDHGPRRRRGDRVRRRVGSAHRPRQARARRSSASGPRSSPSSTTRRPPGTTYPAADVGRIAKRHGALFMLDTVSSLAGLDVRTDEWGVDFNMTGSQKCLAAPLGMAHRVGQPRRRGRRWSAGSTRPPRTPTTSCAGRRTGSRRPAAGTSPTARPRRQPVSIPTHLTQALGAAVPPHPRGRPRRIASAATRPPAGRSAPASTPCGSRCSRMPRSSPTRCRASRRRPASTPPPSSSTCATTTAS